MKPEELANAIQAEEDGKSALSNLAVAVQERIRAAVLAERERCIANMLAWLPEVGACGDYIATKIRHNILPEPDNSP